MPSDESFRNEVKERIINDLETLIFYIKGPEIKLQHILKAVDTTRSDIFHILRGN